MPIFRFPGLICRRGIIEIDTEDLDQLQDLLINGYDNQDFPKEWKIVSESSADLTFEWDGRILDQNNNEVKLLLPSKDGGKNE